MDTCPESTHCRFGPDPQITIPARGLWKCRATRPERRPHSITRFMGQKLLAFRAATKEVHRSPTGAAPAMSTSSSGWRPPRPCASMSRIWKPARWRVLRRRRNRTRSVASRSSLTAPPVGTAWSLSSRFDVPLQRDRCRELRSGPELHCRQTEGCAGEGDCLKLLSVLTSDPAV